MESISKEFQLEADWLVLAGARRGQGMRSAWFGAKLSTAGHSAGIEGAVAAIGAVKAVIIEGNAAGLVIIAKAKFIIMMAAIITEEKTTTEFIALPSFATIKQVVELKIMVATLLGRIIMVPSSFMLNGRDFDHFQVSISSYLFLQQ